MHGFALFNATAEELRASAEEINQLTAKGALRAHIGRVFPLAQAAEAHRLQEESTLGKSGRLSGKIVLTVP